MLLLGIDIGTSGVKAGLFTEGGTLLGLGRASYEIASPRLGWSQCDPELWWRAFIHALREACTQAHVKPSDVGAVGAGVLFPAVMPLDTGGHALHPAILYNDQRSSAQVKQIDSALPRSIYQSYIGNMLMPGTCAVTSVLWLHDTYPELMTREGVWGWANTFINARLTGQVFTDPTMVALSGLADVHTPWRWSDDLCERFNINPDWLPPIAEPADVIGTLTQRAARETGLKAGIPVVCGAGDTAVSAVGAGVLTPGTVVYSAGSTDAVSVLRSQPTPDLRWINCAYVPKETWLSIGATTSSGGSIRWFARTILGYTQTSDTQSTFQHMTKLAATSPLGSQGVLYLPYLLGERTPIWDPAARGVFMGLTMTTTRADLARAVFEGTAFSLRHVVESSEHAAGSIAEPIRAVGGGTHNPLWNQIKADVVQKSFLILDCQETVVFGAALLAGLGAGVYETFEDATHIAKQATGGHLVVPDPVKAQGYDNLFRLYKRVYPANKDIIHTLSAHIDR